MEYKTCTKCGVVKPFAEYSKKVKQKHSLQPRCKTCCLEDTRKWREEQSPDRLKDLYLRRTYGISLQEYQDRLNEQNNKCLLCEIQFNFSTIEGQGLFGDNPVVDHCHTKGHVRGILCNECNRGLGYFKDNVMTFKNAIKYLSGDELTPEGGQ